MRNYGMYARIALVHKLAALRVSYAPTNYTIHFIRWILVPEVRYDEMSLALSWNNRPQEIKLI